MTKVNWIDEIGNHCSFRGAPEIVKDPEYNVFDYRYRYRELRKIRKGMIVEVRYHKIYFMLSPAYPEVVVRVLKNRINI